MVHVERLGDGPIISPDTDPSIGKNIALGYLPAAYCEEGRGLTLEYFHEHYPLKVEAVGYKPLYDPENARPRS